MSKVQPVPESESTGNSQVPPSRLSTVNESAEKAKKDSHEPSKAAEEDLTPPVLLDEEKPSTMQNLLENMYYEPENIDAEKHDDQGDGAAHHKGQMPKFIVHPFSTTRVMWDAFVILLLMYNIVVVPFSIAFEQTVDCEDVVRVQDPLFWLNTIFDCLFFCDILLNFRTAFFRVDELQRFVLVTEWKEIVKHYLKSWFIIDVVGTIPFDFIFNGCVLRANRFLRLPRVLKIFRLLRLLRLARLGRLTRFFEKAKDLFRLNPGLMRLLRFMFAVLLGAHFSACFWFFIGETVIEDYGESWTTDFLVATSNGTIPISNADTATQYVFSLYWSFTTMTTLGYGDITPINAPEVIFTVVNMLFGASVFAYVVGNMASLLSKLDLRATAFKGKMEAVEDFMHQENLPVELRFRVRKFFNYVYNHAREMPDFLGELSSSLKSEVALCLHKELICKAPFFANLDQSFISEVILKLKAIQAAPGDSVFEKGDVAEHMFFIMTGEIEMVVPERISTSGVQTRRAMYFKLREGNYFGEHAILQNTDKIRVTSARALTWCGLFSLSRTDIEKLLRRYPKVKDAFLKKGQVEQLVCDSFGSPHPSARMAGSDGGSASENHNQSDRTLRPGKAVARPEGSFSHMSSPAAMEINTPEPKKHVLPAIASKSTEQRESHGGSFDQHLDSDSGEVFPPDVVPSLPTFDSSALLTVLQRIQEEVEQGTTMHMQAMNAIKAEVLELKGRIAKLESANEA